MKALWIAASVEKASSDDPKHPGWPKGDGRGGRFRPKTADDYPGRPPNDNSSASARMTGTLVRSVKFAIRGLLARAETAPDPRVEIAALLVEVGLEVYPYVSAYFDSPKSLEALRAAAQGPTQIGYDDHHIVEQATANPDGSEDERMDSADNLARIPTVRHWELNRWYQRANPQLDGMTPQRYLDRKSWEERLRVGLMGLRDTGVSK